MFLQIKETTRGIMYINSEYISYVHIKPGSLKDTLPGFLPNPIVVITTRDGVEHYIVVKKGTADDLARNLLIASGEYVSGP